MYISDAAEVVHRAFYGQSIGVDMLEGLREVLSPPDDIMRLCPVWLRTTKLSPLRQQVLMDYAAIGLRHDLVRELALRFYNGLRTNKWKGRPTPAEVFQARKAWEELDYQGNNHPIVVAVRDWRGWDPVQTAGWIYDNVEKAIEEIDMLWPKVKLAATRLKNGGELNAATVRSFCSDILGAGFKGNRQMEVLTRFHFDALYFGASSKTSIHDGVSFVEMTGHSEMPLISGSYEDVMEGLAKNLIPMSHGKDASASAARLLMVLRTGNYIIFDNRLCRISLPVDPTSGSWGDVSRPEKMYPIPADYQWCARREVQFAVAGFVWPTMVALRGDRELLGKMIDELWIPTVFEMFFLIAKDKQVPQDCALAFLAAVYARLAAISGWFNPVAMHHRLREIFLETADILQQFSETIVDLEQALTGDLFRSPGDIINLAGGAVDADLEENERMGILIRHQRETASYVAEAYPDLYS